MSGTTWSNSPKLNLTGKVAGKLKSAAAARKAAGKQAVDTTGPSPKTHPNPTPKNPAQPAPKYVPPPDRRDQDLFSNRSYTDATRSEAELGQKAFGARLPQSTSWNPANKPRGKHIGKPAVSDSPFDTRKGRHQ
jgi:hypothetical protein